MVHRLRLPLGAVAVTACVWPAAARGDEPEVEEVRVLGAARSPASAPKDPTVAGAVVSREEIAAPGLRATELLRGQVGVQVAEMGGAGAPGTASIRGATPAQLPVYLAGVRLNDEIAGTADLSRVPLWLIDRVEVYRGNAPLEADRLGIGGAIFFEPRWPRDRALAVGATLGSFGTRGLRAWASSGDRDAAVLAGVSAEAATNDYPFTNDHGTLLVPGAPTESTMSNADVTTYDAWLLGRARVHDAATIDAFANVTARDQGVPTLALVPSRRARASFDRAISGARAELPVTRSVTLVAQSAVSLAASHYSDPLQELALAAHDVRLSGARASERLAVRAEASDSLTVRASLDASSETLGRDDDGSRALRARRLSSRGAIAARQWLGDSFSVQALAAVECDGTSPGSGSGCDAFEPTGRAGISWTRATWEAFANAGTYARVPSLAELYGVSPVVRGNPMLFPESGVTCDAGLRWKARGAGEDRAPWASVAGFVRWADDLVGYELSPQGYAEPLNVGRARFTGAEAQAGAPFLRWFAFDLNVTFLDPRNTTPGRITVNDVLPLLSRLVVVPRVWGEWHTGLGWADRIRAEMRFIHESSRYADAAGLAVIPEQSSLDAELLVQTRDGAWTVRLRVADLLDAQRFDVVGFPLPRRSAFAAMEAKW
jgi:iron complex outermembrane receptor protein